MELNVGDVVTLTTGENVLVTDVPEPYEGMVETLFVYTPDLDAERHQEPDLRVTDRKFVTANLGPVVRLVPKTA